MKEMNEKECWEEHVLAQESTENIVYKQRDRSE